MQLLCAHMCSETLRTRVMRWLLAKPPPRYPLACSDIFDTLSLRHIVCSPWRGCARGCILDLIHRPHSSHLRCESFTALESSHQRRIYILEGVQHLAPARTCSHLGNTQPSTQHAMRQWRRLLRGLDATLREHLAACPLWSVPTTSLLASHCLASLRKAPIWPASCGDGKPAAPLHRTTWVLPVAAQDTMGDGG